MARLPSIALFTLLVLAPVAAFVPQGAATHEEPEEPPADFAESHDALGDARSGGALAWTGEKAYLFGGRNATGAIHAGVVEYDPVTGTQTVLDTDEIGEAINPFPARFGWSALWDAPRERVLVFGGVSYACSPFLDLACQHFPEDDALAFYPTNGSWEVLATNESPYTAYRGVVAVGDLAYLFGGCTYDDASCTNETRAFDMTTDQFVPVADALPLAAGHMLALAFDGDVFLLGGASFGGQRSAPELDSIWRFEPASGFSIEEATLPAPTADAAGFHVDLEVFLLGGGSSVSMPSDGIYRWRIGSPVVDTLDATLPNATSDGHAFHVGPFAYLVGGDHWEAEQAVPAAEIVQVLPAPVATGATAYGARIVVETLGALASSGDAADFTVFVNGMEIPVLATSLGEMGLQLTLPAGLGNLDEVHLDFDRDASAPTDAWGNPLGGFADLIVTVAPPDPASLPSPRWGPAAAWDETLGALVTLGGVDEACSLDYGFCDNTTALAYDPTTGDTWTLGVFELGSPDASVVTPYGVALVGPRTDLVATSARTVYLWNATDRVLSPAGTLPIDGDLSGASAVFDGGRFLYVFGGAVDDCGECATLTDAIWRLDLDAPGSEATLLDLALPEPMRGTAAAWLATPSCPEGCAYLLGGRNATGVDSDRVLRIDFATGAVETLPFTLPDARSRAVAFPVGESIVYLGGERLNAASFNLVSEVFLSQLVTPTSVVRVFPDTGETLTLPDAIPRGRTDAAYAFDGANVYAVGGTTASYVSISEIDAFTPDLTAPVLDLSLDAADGLADETGDWWISAPTFSFDATDADGNVTDARALVGDSVVEPGTTVVLPEGATQIVVSAKDDSGNVASESRLVRVDLTPPDIASTLDVTPAENERGWRNEATTVAWTPEEGSTVGVSLDGSEYLDQASLVLDSEAANGTVYQVHLREQDAAGHVTTHVVEVRVDTIAPYVTNTLAELDGTSATVVFEFSENMLRAPTAAALEGAEGWNLDWQESDTRLVLTRDELPFGTHHVTLGPSATDEHGLALESGASESVTREPPRRASSSPPPILVLTEPTPEAPSETNETVIENATEETPVAVTEEEPIVLDTPLEPAREEPLEETSTSGSGDEDTEAAEPEPPTQPEPQPDEQASIVIVQPDDVGVSVGSGARGVVTVRIDGARDPGSLFIVLVDEDGVETILSEGALETTWDTTASDDGYYTIEARRRVAPPEPGEIGIASTHAAGITLASADVLVRNPPAGALTVTTALVGGVLVAAAAHAGLSAVAGASSSASSAAGGFDPLGFAQEIAIDAGQDKLRDKTKEKAALDRRRRIRSWVAGIASLALLAALWALAEAEAWTVRDWLVALPIVGAAAALVTLMKYGAESALAWTTHARPRVRLWIAGAISLAVSALAFRNPFGYPGYVDEQDESEARNTWRMQGLRALATIAGAVAFMLPFLALATVAPWQFVSVGILIAVTNAATSAMPFGPLPGRDVWRWSKPLAIGIALAGFALYVAYAAALVPLWTLAVVGATGAIGYAASLAHFRRALGPRKPVRVPVQVPIPVRDADEATGRPEPTSRAPGTRP